MKSHEILRKVFNDAGGCKELALKMPFKQNTLYRWSMPSSDGEGTGVENPLDKVEQILKHTKDIRIAQWVCERAGGHFAGNPKAALEQGVKLDAASSKIVQNMAATLALISQAAEDGKITEEEARDIRRRWNKLKSDAETFVRCCEERNFSAIQ